MMKKVTKAVIPAAGLGTRVLEIADPIQVYSFSLAQMVAHASAQFH